MAFLVSLRRAYGMLSLFVQVVLNNHCCASFYSLSTPKSLTDLFALVEDRRGVHFFVDGLDFSRDKVFALCELGIFEADQFRC